MNVMLIGSRRLALSCSCLGYISCFQSSLILFFFATIAGSKYASSQRELRVFGLGCMRSTFRLFPPPLNSRTLKQRCMVVSNLLCCILIQVLNQLLFQTDSVFYPFILVCNQSITWCYTCLHAEILLISVFDFCRSFPLNHNTNLERVGVRVRVRVREPLPSPEYKD